MGSLAESKDTESGTAGNLFLSLQVVLPNEDITNKTKQAKERKLELGQD